MRVHLVGLLLAIGLAIGLSGTKMIGQFEQIETSTVDAHVAAAKAAAGQEHLGMIGLCRERRPPQPGEQPAPSRENPDDPSTWYAEPAKVFDNLYFVGTRSRSVWAVTTSEGIIVIDTIAPWSVEREVVQGLKKLGLDPAQIKYAVASHAHADHYGGARYLQDKFGARVVQSALDWDLSDRSDEPRPRRDLGVVVSDGQKLTLGDTTLTFYLTPGHTLGTISTLIPVRDGGRRHLAALFGGTAFLWQSRFRPNYIAREVGDSFWFETYIRGVQHFREMAERAGADVPLANHTGFDGTRTKIPALAMRKPGDSHPYVMGTEHVKRYLTVAVECAKAGLLRSRSGASAW